MVFVDLCTQDLDLCRTMSTHSPRPLRLVTKDLIPWRPKPDSSAALLDEPRESGAPTGSRPKMKSAVDSVIA